MNRNRHIAFGAHVALEGEVCVWGDVSNVDPWELKRQICAAQRVQSTDLYMDICSGEAFLCEGAVEADFWALAAARPQDSGPRRKPNARSQFNAKRNSLIAQMLISGVPYVCAWPGCTENERLTVDLSNLQFMCSHHNSSKGTRLLSSVTAHG